MGLVAEDGIVVMTAGSQTGNPKSIFQGSQFLCLLLWSLHSGRPIGAYTFTLFVRVIKLSENIMLLLPQGWQEWHHFDLGFTQRSDDVG